MADVSRSRRAFIVKVAALLLAGAGLRRYLTPLLPAEGKVLLRADSRDIPANSALVFREERVALVREGDELLALSLVCTHLGCTVTVTADYLACPCHGSRFDRSGRVMNGPADRPLARFTVQRSGDLVEVLAS